MLLHAQTFLKNRTTIIHSQADFYDYFSGPSGFALAHWNGDPEIEAKVKSDLNVTIRCIPLVSNPEPGICIFSGEKSPQRVVFAKAY
jgi:prolyl-tRNA synthetase